MTGFIEFLLVFLGMILVVGGNKIRKVKIDFGNKKKKGRHEKEHDDY